MFLKNHSPLSSNLGVSWSVHAAPVGEARQVGELAQAPEYAHPGAGVKSPKQHREVRDHASLKEPAKGFSCFLRIEHHTLLGTTMYALMQ